MHARIHSISHRRGLRTGVVALALLLGAAALPATGALAGGNISIDPGDSIAQPAAAAAVALHTAVPPDGGQETAPGIQATQKVREAARSLADADGD